MPGTQHPPALRRSSIASVDTLASQTSDNAAFLGATAAFGRPAPIPKVPTNINSTNITSRTSYDGGALSAASMVSTTPQRPPSKMPNGGASSGSGKERAILNFSKMPNLSIPQQSARSQSKSPSQQAAVLAASRAPPAPGTKPVPGAKPAIAAKPRNASGNSRTDDPDFNDKPTDTTSIPPTNALVDLFERRQKLAASSTVKLPNPVTVSSTKDVSIESPKPLRSGITSMIRMELEEAKKQGGRIPGADSGDKVHAASTLSPGASSIDSFASAPEDPLSEQAWVVLPKTGPLKASRSINSLPAVSRQGATMAPPELRRRLPSVSPGRLTTSKAMPIRQPSQSTIGTHDFAPSSAQSARSVHAQFNQQNPRHRTPLTTGDQLANALVASSLASSRAPSPTRLEPPPLPGRRKKGHHHHTLGFGRTPSPAKATGMLHTLRPQHTSSSSESDDELHPYRRHKKKRLVRKHPNRHHEGDRKRWRDAVTERERKRYEGVWAANKGMLYTFTLEEQKSFQDAPDAEHTREVKAATAEQVSNIVAREIWSRSRLPESTLEMVWDLVDHHAVGRLDKIEFVVGLWLIDQRLKGRKLPVKVSDSVWTSVKGLQGIKIRR